MSAPQDHSDPTSDIEPDDISDDPRLLPIVEEYLARLDAGEHPTSDEYLRQFPELGRSLHACLAALDAVHGVISQERLAAGESATPCLDERLPKQLGDFRIIRDVGSGGMGVVYEAIQISLRRRVALKTLSFAATLQKRHLQRFLNEAHAAAHLHHPHIVPVFAVGSERGVYYYAMQFIDGISLAELLGQLRDATDDASCATSDGGSASRPSQGDEHVEHVFHARSRELSETVNQLSLGISTLNSHDPHGFFRAAAGWIRQAAQGLAYAHDLGIVHRDVKPANLMLDDNGHLWITDFGLAQIRSENDLTRTGDLMGTLRYMSPEQAAGDRHLVDHRTDVYALGATLYELLTLRPVYEGRGREALLRQVATREPQPLRLINKKIPLELETIVLKAISRSPQDRYASAHELADDLGRFLEDKPVLARRPSVAERALRWTRRRPVWVAAIAGLLSLQSVAIAVHDRMIAAEQARTAAALEREEARAMEAEQRFLQARRAVDALIDTSEEEIADDPRYFATRKRLLETAVAFYDELIEQQSRNPQTQLDLAADQERAKVIIHSLNALQTHLQVRALAAPTVQAELNLSEEQRPRVLDMVNESNQAASQFFDELPNLSQEARRRHLLESAGSEQATLTNVLTSAQRERLLQIVLQVQGTAAFQEPEIIRSLGLTRDQRRKIHAIELATLLRLGPDNGTPDGPDAERDANDPRFMQALNEVLGLLSPEQAARWRQLTGSAFAGHVSLRPPRMPGHSRQAIEH